MGFFKKNLDMNDEFYETLLNKFIIKETKKNGIIFGQFYKLNKEVFSSFDSTLAFDIKDGHVDTSIFLYQESIDFTEKALNFFTKNMSIFYKNDKCIKSYYKLISIRKQALERVRKLKPKSNVVSLLYKFSTSFVFCFIYIYNCIGLGHQTQKPSKTNLDEDVRIQKKTVERNPCSVKIESLRPLELPEEEKHIKEVCACWKAHLKSLSNLTDFEREKRLRGRLFSCSHILSQFFVSLEHYMNILLIHVSL